LALFTGLAWAVASAVEPAALRQRLLVLVALFGVFGVGVVVVASAILTRQFRRPVRELVEAVSRVGTGGVGPRIAAGEEALAEAFNRASEELTARIARLEEDREQLRTVLSGMVEGVVALDAEQRILYANDRASQFLELPAPAPVGRHLWEMVRHRALLDAVRSAGERPEPHHEEFTWAGAAVRSLTVHAARLPGSPPRGTVLVLH